MRRKVRTLGAVGLAGLGAIVAVAAFEGAHTMVTGRSLVRGELGRGDRVRTALRDDERISAAIRGGGGPYALALDPDVGFTMKPGSSPEFHGIRATCDAHGTRARVGPAVTDPSPCILLLGDSMTFGFGLRDDETLGHVLERELAASAPGANPVVHTLAVPGWNLWNCHAALCQHIGRLRPDVVIYTPVSNDLFDSFATDENGFRTHEFDPRHGGTRPHVSLESYLNLMSVIGPRMSMTDFVGFRAAGGVVTHLPIAVSNVTPDSRRRWSEFASLISDMQARAERRFALNLWFDDEFERECHVVAAKIEIPVIEPFGEKTPGDLLADDPHPNAVCVAARSRMIARFLIRQGWVGGTAPELAPAWQSRVVELRRDDLEREHVELIERRAAVIGSVIDTTTAAGLHQIYGGVAADTTVGRGFAAGLRRQGSELALLIERLPSSTGLYPLELTVEVDRHRFRLSVPPATDADLGWEARAPLPTTDTFFDVTIRCSSRVTEVSDSTSRLAAFRLRRLASE